MKKLCLDWAHIQDTPATSSQSSPPLKGARLHEAVNAGYVFHIALRNVRHQSSLASIILSQHKTLKHKKVTEAEIDWILENERPVIIMDGYDEYIAASSEDDIVVETLEKSLSFNTCVIVTSRETASLTEIRQHVDHEAEITGFDEVKTWLFIQKFLPDTQSRDRFLKELERVKLCRPNYPWETGPLIFDSLLHHPILLWMVCVLNETNKALPNTKADIIEAITDRCINYAAEKDGRPKPTEEERNKIKLAVGKLALFGLKNDKLMFTQEEAVKIARDVALSSGLLLGSQHEVSGEEETSHLSMWHKLVQEYLAACHMADEADHNNPAIVTDLFKTWDDITMHHQEVAQFLYTRIQNKKLIIQCIADLFIMKADTLIMEWDVGYFYMKVSAYRYKHKV